MTISTQLTARFSEPSTPPAAALAAWRSERPAWLPGKYEEIDNSYESVTWEWRHTPASGKLVPFGRFFGMQTVYRLTALFQDDGSGGSRITVNGAADDDTHQAIAAAALEVFEGGIV